MARKFKCSVCSGWLHVQVGAIVVPKHNYKTASQETNCKGSRKVPSAEKGK